MNKLKLILNMIKFEHTVFALPFAFMGAFLAAQTLDSRLPSWWAILWIVIAMVAARSAAMTFNRIADAEIDAKNPRTKDRPLPTGKISPRFAYLFLLVNLTVFVFAAAMLNTLCLLLSPLAMVIILGYSFTKRFTALCHLFLGLAIGLAPSAAWIAVAGTYDWLPLVLTGVVATWVAGFDIIYACQDVEFDRAEPRVHSLPKRLGVAGALAVSALLHAGTVALLAALPALEPLLASGWYYGGVGLVAVLLVIEHALVRPSNLSRAGQVFWLVNGWVGFILLGAMLAALFV